MLLATKIYDAIEAKGWSQKEFAIIMEQNESTICRWLSGKHNFTTDTLFDIQDALDISLLDTKPAQQMGASYHVTLKAQAEISPRVPNKSFKIFDVYQTPISKMTH